MEMMKEDLTSMWSIVIGHFTDISSTWRGFNFVDQMLVNFVDQGLNFVDQMLVIFVDQMLVNSSSEA